MDLAELIDAWDEMVGLRYLAKRLFGVVAMAAIRTRSSL